MSAYRSSLFRSLKKEVSEKLPKGLRFFLSVNLSCQIDGFIKGNLIPNSEGSLALPHVGYGSGAPLS